MIKNIFTRENYNIWLKTYGQMMMVTSVIIVILAIIINHVSYTNSSFVWTGGAVDLLKTSAVGLAAGIANSIMFLPFALFIFFGHLITGKLFLKMEVTNQTIIEIFPYWFFAVVYLPLKLLISYLLGLLYLASSGTVPEKFGMVGVIFAWLFSLPGIVLEYYILGYLIWATVYEYFIEPELPRDYFS